MDAMQDSVDEAAREWTKAWNILVAALKEIRVPNVDHNAKALLARLAAENMLVVESDSIDVPPCGWTADELHGHYMTGCGNGFFFAEDGDLADSKFKHCMYCGGPIVSK
jgi:hypothetical protein